MPPILALVGCYIFVFAIYRWDAKRNPYPSAVLWFPCLWMMRCGSRAVDTWVYGGEGGERLDPIAVGILILCGLLVLAKRRCNWPGIIGHNFPIFVFYIFMSMSVLWSDAIENPAIKLLRPFGDLIMAMIIVTEENPRLAIMTMFRRTAIILIPFSIILIKYYPALGRGEDKHWGVDPWVGVTTHKNPLGQLCIVSSLAFLWYIAEAKKQGLKILRQRVALLYMGLTAYLMNGGGEPGSRSSTSLLCLIVAVALFLLFGYMKDGVRKLVRWGVGAIVGVGLFALVLQVAGSSLQAVVAESVGKDPTLTDRTFLWADVIRIGGGEHPWLGSGYGSFWVPSLYTKLSPMVDNRPAEAHNGYLETFANLGLVGVALLAIVILKSLFSAVRSLHEDFDYGRLRLSLLIMILVMNYSEATFPRGTHLWWFGFLIVALYALPFAPAREEVPEPEPAPVEHQDEPEAEYAGS